MPKSKKIRSSALEGQSVRHEPLGKVINKDAHLQRYGNVSVPRANGKKWRNNDGNGELDSKTSQRILQMSQQQQLEIDAELERNERIQKNREREQRVIDDSDNEEENEDDFPLVDEADSDNYIEHDDQGYVDIVDGTEGLSSQDEALVAAMMKPTAQQERRTLADMILEKIEEKEAVQRGENIIDDGDVDLIHNLPPKVVEVYTEIGKILSRYTAGKLPKAFKVIPSLSNWEEILYLTRPDQWTPHACEAATRIFASNLNPKMAQRFYNLILLDSVRADIEANKKLNYHYYLSLKKAVYKPAAFFKGIVLPLCKDPTCTLREAAIVASVLQRVSIPVHHSAVAIHKLALQQEYSGATSIFIKTLLNKKYSLPAPVIGSLLRHFAGFVNYDHHSEEKCLPVLWHQALLVFVQRYKNELQEESREALRLVMKKHFHHKITPEIRRELFGLQAWKEERKHPEIQGGHEDMDMEL